MPRPSNHHSEELATVRDQRWNRSISIPAGVCRAPAGTPRVVEGRQEPREAACILKISHSADTGGLREMASFRPPKPPAGTAASGRSGSTSGGFAGLAGGPAPSCSMWQRKDPRAGARAEKGGASRSAKRPPMLGDGFEKRKFRPRREPSPERRLVRRPPANGTKLNGSGPFNSGRPPKAEPAETTNISVK